MASYNLYHTYNVDDSNIWCGQILVSNCNWDHVYMNPCDLLQTCDLQFPRQLTSQCVADFLNNLDTQTAGHYVRISSNNCLEAVPISVPPSGWCTVGVDATDDECGYLVDKIIWDGDITITPIWPGDNRKLEISYTWPTSLSDLADVSQSLYSACDNGTNAFLRSILKVNNTNDWIESECVYKPVWSIYAEWNINISSSNILKNEIKHFFLWGLSNFWADNWMVITATVPPTWVIIWSSITWLKATKDWIRKVSMKGNVRVNAGIQAFRVYVYCSDNSLNGCVDSKFWASDNPKQPLVRRYDQPLTNETYAYFNIWWECLVYANEWDIFSLMLAVDSNAGTDISPLMTIFAGWLTGGTYNSPTGVYWSIAWTSLQIEFIRGNDFDNKNL